MKNQFVIAGPIESEEQLWWNNEKGWVEFKDATPLPPAILDSPLPPGATGVMEITEDWCYVDFFPVTPSPVGA